VIALTVHKDFQRVRKLPFCYLCGLKFLPEDPCNADHVPPSSAFNARDREPPLKLKTHMACHKPLSTEDKKVGQLIAMRRGEHPASRRDQALNFIRYPDGRVAFDNLSLERALWRWIRGFHAALYAEPLSGKFAVTLPFPQGTTVGGRIEMKPILPQHFHAVEAIKRNRVVENVDRIRANKGKLRYECVWCDLDNAAGSICVFALDIYDWKDLGGYSDDIPARGCAGLYMRANGGLPETAARDRKSIIAFPNEDRLDPFAP
jgi:hypothetical protein